MSEINVKEMINDLVVKGNVALEEFKQFTNQSKQLSNSWDGVVFPEWS